MPRLALILVVLAAAALPTAAVAAPKTSTLITSGLDDCVAATTSATGSAIFQARMLALPASDRLLMRFDLQVREPGAGDWSAVSTEPNGWIRSASGVGQLIWHKRFEALTGPASYRARVRYRWYDSSGALLASDERRTPICTQPDLRPNLELGTLSQQPGPSSQPGLVRYAVSVRNTGKGDADSFDVVFRMPGQSPAIASVSGLPAGDAQGISFLAPACAAGDLLRVLVDPDDTVDESDERDNTLSMACPPAA
jgi:hypothetical protein